jgi:CBS domain containing-hemolysin-like protein
MVNRVLDLQNLRVRQVALPLANVVSVDADEPVETVVQRCREHRLGRLPVWRAEGATRRIVGLVQLNTVLFAPDGAAGRRAGDLVQPAVFVEEDLRLEQALERLRRSGQRVALVVGADGRERGLIGLQDILKIVFGEVPR